MATHAEHGDDREDRRVLTGLGGGALVGGTLGLVLGTTLVDPLIGAVAALAGAAGGAMVGRMIAARVSVDDWDPRASDRPYVGTHAPDDDSLEELPTESDRPRR
jgi:hypothetical protein